MSDSDQFGMYLQDLQQNLATGAAAEPWGITDKELQEIRRSLAELG
ncbi:MAG: hypothetical protein SVX38_08230 [Chloroflexota bacterium]|nr:hypothetical protein [Chloroflexota bacterium]